MNLASHSKFPNHLVHQIQQQKAKISQNRRQTFKWLVKCIANCSILLTTNTFALDGSKSRQYFINSPQQTKGEMGVTNACKSIFASTEFVHSFSNQNFRGEVFFCLFCPGVTFAANSSAMEVLVATFLATEGYLHAVCHSPT